MLVLLIAFHPKALTSFADPTAGLLAFHIADGLPIRRLANSGMGISKLKWITVAGTAPDLTGIPF